jgi:hypothetical protein
VSRATALELGLVALVVATLVLVVLCLMDVARRPPETWARAGVRRELWMALLILGAVLPLPGIAVPLIYLGGVRRRLDRISG